jgi:hypothetical protein
MTGYVTRMEVARNAYRILVGKFLEKWPLGRPMGWERALAHTLQYKVVF